MHSRTGKKLNLSLHEVKQLFDLSNRIADTTEVVLEEEGAYSSDFIKKTKASLAEARRGKAKKVGHS